MHCTVDSRWQAHRDGCKSDVRPSGAIAGREPLDRPRVSRTHQRASRAGALGERRKRAKGVDDRSRVRRGGDGRRLSTGAPFGVRAGNERHQANQGRTARDAHVWSLPRRAYTLSTDPLRIPVRRMISSPRRTLRKRAAAPPLAPESATDGKRPLTSEDIRGEDTGRAPMKNLFPGKNVQPALRRTCCSRRPS
jgi:hypothetical protein